MKDYCALIGNWLFQPEPKGFDLFSYDEQNAHFSFRGSYLEDCTIGQIVPGKLPNLVYMVNEAAEHDGIPGSGGCILAVQVGANKAEIISNVPSCGSKPSYCAVSGDGRFLLVSHHSTRTFVTKVHRGTDGVIRAAPDHDDTTLVLFHLKEDGSIGAACDMLITEGDEMHPRSFLHSVMASPSGRLFAVCDPGMDRIYMVAIDENNGRLLLRDTACVEAGCEPRYSAFHPAAPLLFVNNERSKVVFSYRYDRITGKLQRVSELWLRSQSQEISEPVKSCDIKIHPNGRILYNSVSGENSIYVMRIQRNGTLEQIQVISCRGETPRGLCISPEGNYLFSMNVTSKDVACFSIRKDGTLAWNSIAAQSKHPGNMAIVGTKGDHI